MWRSLCNGGYLNTGGKVLCSFDFVLVYVAAWIHAAKMTVIPPRLEHNAMWGQPLVNEP